MTAGESVVEPGTGARVVLDEARVRYRAIRDTVEGYNLRVAWLFGLLGVLLIAVVTGFVGLAPSPGLRVTFTAALALIAVAMVALTWAAWPVTLSGIDDDAWFSDDGLTGDELAVMAGVALSLMDAVRADLAPGGPLVAKKRRFLLALSATGAATASLLVCLTVGAWS